MENLTVKGAATLKPTFEVIDKPFAVTFTHEKKSITVQLQNAEDVLYLAKLYSVFLSENGIKNKITESQHE